MEDKYGFGEIPNEEKPEKSEERDFDVEQDSENTTENEDTVVIADEIRELPDWDNKGRKKKRRTVSLYKAVVVTVILVLLSASSAFLGTIYFVQGGTGNGLGISREGWAKLKWGIDSLRNTYYEEIDESKLIDGALLGMSSVLDDYTVYMNKEETENFISEVDADSYTGVGLYITMDSEDNTVTVISPLSGSPADKAGIKTGDKIIAVDGVSVKGSDLNKASEMMLGEAGTTVNVTIIKADTGETVTLELTRAKVRLETVYSQMIEDNIGYIQISQFGVNTYDEFETHFEEIKSKGAEKLVIDLRNNPGGYLEQAVEIADLFVDKGDMIVYTMDKNGNRDEYIAKKKPCQMQVVIIANGGTASASEILIGALHDNGKATLVGEKTYGKGVTQTLVPGADGSAFKITDSRYYTPSGKCINEKGINPDLEVKNTETQDLQLKAAVEALE